MRIFLEKLKSIKLNFLLIAFIAYTIKVLSVSVGFADAAVLAVIAALCGFRMHLSPILDRTSKLDDKTKEDVQELKNALSKLNLTASLKPGERKYF